MHVLAVGTFTTQDFQQHLPEEGEVVARWFQEGALKDVYLKADRSGPILVLNDTDTAGAQKRMADLPFVVHGVATFEYVEILDRPDVPPTRN
jgi:hypothetical protein